MKVHEKWPRYTPLVCWEPTVPIGLTVHVRAGRKRRLHGRTAFRWAFRSVKDDRIACPGFRGLAVGTQTAGALRAAAILIDGPASAAAYSRVSPSRMRQAV